MLLTLLVLLLVAIVLALPAFVHGTRRLRRHLAARRATGRPREVLDVPDPGRERRAEQRARELLRSCVNEEEWAMYRDLGFIRVWGSQAGARRAERTPGAARGRPRLAGERSDVPAARASGRPAYAYVIYPHKPVVAFVPETRELLAEYCVEFPDLGATVAGSRLPDSDDVLAKWMALTGSEWRLLASANMHLPGRQLDPARVRRDLWRLAEWERQRRRGGRVASRG